MTSVAPRAGLRYGAFLFGYWLALLVVSGVLVAAGGALVYVQVTGVWALGGLQGRALVALGGFVAFLGVVVFGSGQFGLAYKLVHDAVGTASSRRPPVADATVSTADSRDAGESGAVAGSEGAPAGGTATEQSDVTAGGRSGAASGTASTTQPRQSQVEDDETGPAGPGRAGERRRERADDPGPTEPDSQGQSSTDGTATGDPDGDASVNAGADASAGADPESPEQVASESPIAEELGFKRSDERGETRPGDAGADASSSPDGDPETPDVETAGAGVSVDESASGESPPDVDPLDAEDWETGDEKLSEESGGGDENGSVDGSENVEGERERDGNRSGDGSENTDGDAGPRRGATDGSTGEGG